MTGEALPAEPAAGLVLDCEGDVWRRTDTGMWECITAGNPWATRWATALEAYGPLVPLVEGDPIGGAK